VPEPIIDVASSPWLEAVYQAPHEDGPRLVLADVLQQRQDAQGDFIAYCLADAKDGARTELATKANALLEAHRELWLGRLQATVAAGDADFSRGLLTGANVYFGEDADEHLDYPEWATVERLHFSHQSEQRYPARLTGLREVTNVTDARALVTGAPIEQLEALQVEVRALGELLELVTRLEFELPALRRLAVTFYRQEWMAAAEAEPLLAVAPIVSHWSQQLTELTLLGTTYFSGPELVDPQTEDAQVARAMIRRAMTVPLPRQARLRVGFLSSARLPTGWLATIAPVDAADSGTLRLELAGLGPTSAPALRTAMLIDLPARFTHIDLVAGRCWSPRERDVSEVAAATGRVVRVVK
jgi:uncharacterized protein (TIGR02996 family)